MHAAGSRAPCSTANGCWIKADYAEAVERFRLATSTPLLETNAQAWNYLGLACHLAGQPTKAEQAYQKALALNHDLVEARFNLGCFGSNRTNLNRPRAS